MWSATIILKFNCNERSGSKLCPSEVTLCSRDFSVREKEKSMKVVFDVSSFTINRWISRFHQTGDFEEDNELLPAGLSF